MEKKLVVHFDEAKSGVLHGGAGTFRVLIDEPTSGAKHFSLSVNTMKAGVEGAEHKHPDNEHCWYILSGTGTMHILGESYKLGPEMAIFAPADVLHKIDVDPDEDLTYVLIYAPGGPEQKLIEKGAHAFDDE
jgi:mannose-6-phosphate isomerase-like protein (cupin superfamily)